MKENIAATYDLVYIGGDISAMDRIGYDETNKSCVYIQNSDTACEQAEAFLKSGDDGKVTKYEGSPGSLYQVCRCKDRKGYGFGWKILT